jgi:DNA-binding transcriptional ArsR family regulator
LLAISEAGLVVARKEGVRMMYYVSDPRVFTLVDLAGEIARLQLSERAEILEIL